MGIKCSLLHEERWTFEILWLLRKKKQDDDQRLLTLAYSGRLYGLACSGQDLHRIVCLH